MAIKMERKKDTNQDKCKNCKSKRAAERQNGRTAERKEERMVKWQEVVQAGGQEDRKT